MRIVVLSPRVAPGILTLATWDALREASSVHAVEDAPHVRAIVASGIDVEISGAAPALNPDTVADNDVWIAPPGDVAWARTLADQLLDERGEAEVEVIFGSYDMPGAALLDVVEVIDRLRRECPWTMIQTHTSLRSYLLEEAEEAVEALDAGDGDHLRDELGDLLMQVMLHARIAAESDGWDIDDVAAGIANKLIRRSPHVFADGTAGTPEEVDAAWQRLKSEERAGEHPSS